MKPALVLLIALTALPAWAQPWQGRDRPERDQRQEQQPPPHRGPPPERRMDREERRGGALSDEERRSLHRDLDRANRELYRR